MPEQKLDFIDIKRFDVSKLNRLNFPGKIATWDKAKEFITRGIISGCLFDLEVNQLSKIHAVPFRTGIVVIDIAGNILAEHEINMKLSEMESMSPEAALIVRVDPDDVYNNPNALPADVGMEKIRRILETAREKVWDAYPAVYDGEKLLFKVFPFINEEGNLDYFKIRNEGREIRYRTDREPAKQTFGKEIDDDGNKWFWTPVQAANVNIGHNIFGADTHWMTAGFNKYSLYKKFSMILRQQPHKQYNLDTLHLAQLAAAYGEERPDGVKIGRRYDQELGRYIPSLKLSDLMEANTYAGDDMVGRQDGVKMLHDGSLYTDKLGHKSPKWDSLAAGSLFFFMQEREPEITSDWLRMLDKEGAQRLIWKRNHDPDNWQFGQIGNQPFITFTRFRRSKGITPYIGVAVNFDEEGGNRKKALIIRLDQDPEKIRYKQKRLFDLSIEELSLWIKDQLGRSDSVLQIADIRKMEAIAPGGLFFTSGQNSGVSIETVQENFKKLIAPKGGDKQTPSKSPLNFQSKLVHAYALLQKYSQYSDRYRLPMADDEIYTDVGDLPTIELEDSSGKPLFLEADLKEQSRSFTLRDSEWHVIKELSSETLDIFHMLHQDLSAQWNNDNRLKDLYMEALAPPKFLFRNESPLSLDQQRSKYISRRRKINHNLVSRGGAPLPFIDERLLDFDYRENHPEDVDLFDDMYNRMKSVGFGGRFAEAESSYEYLSLVVEGDPVEFTNELIQMVLAFPHFYPIRDNSPRVNLYDNETDQIISLRDIMQMPPDTQTFLKENRLEAKFEPVRSQPTKHGLMRRLIEHDKVQDMPEEMQEQITEYFDAFQTLIVQGPPDLDPSKHPYATDKQSFNRLLELQENISQGRNPVLVTGPLQERQFMEMGALDHYGDAADAIERLEKWKKFFEERLEKYQWTPRKLELMGYNPDTARVEPFNQYQVDPNNSEIITIPEGHLFNPQSRVTLGFNMRQLKKSAPLTRAFKENKDIILKGSESGRLYLLPKPKLVDDALSKRYRTDVKIDLNSSKFNTLNQVAESDYSKTGHEFPEAKKRLLISGEQILPLSGVKSIRARNDNGEVIQTLRVPHWVFNGLTAPTLPTYDFGGQMSEFIIPHHYDIKSGEIRLQERIAETKDGVIQMNLDSDGRDTGFEVEASVKDVEIITLKQLKEQIDNGDFTGQDAMKCGFDSTQSLYRYYLSSFTNLGRTVESDEYKLMRIKLKPVNLKKTPIVYNRVNDNRAKLTAPIFN